MREWLKSLELRDRKAIREDIVAPNFTTVFHELAEAFEKIDGGEGDRYADGHNAALDRGKILRDHRPLPKGKQHGRGAVGELPEPGRETIIKK